VTANGTRLGMARPHLKWRVSSNVGVRRAGPNIIRRMINHAIGINRATPQGVGGDPGRELCRQASSIDALRLDGTLNSKRPREFISVRYFAGISNQNVILLPCRNEWDYHYHRIRLLYSIFIQL